MGITEDNHQFTQTGFTKFFIIIFVTLILWNPSLIKAENPVLFSVNELSPLDKFIANNRNPQIDVFMAGNHSQLFYLQNIETMPLHPETKKILEQEGRLKNLVEHVNTLKKLRATEGYFIDGYRDHNQFYLESSPSISAVTGIQRAIVLMVDFSDNTSKTNSTGFHTLLFGSGSSMRNFYISNSYNKVFVEGTVFGWYRSNTTYVYYVNGNNGFGSYPRNAQRLVEDVVDLANPTVDFSQYDQNNDTWVDAIFVIHSGRGAEYTGSVNDIWSHAWSTQVIKNVDGKKIWRYSMEPEYWSSPGDMTIGVYSHELGHVFGLPDFYDTDYSSEGLGNWSLMAGGSWNGNNGNQPSHLDAWCKIDLGWVTPIVPTNNIMGASIPAVETTQTIYKLWTNGTASNQYYLVENRQRTGYDSRIPSSGLAIYHVDDNQGSNNNEWYSGHTTSGHYWVALEQADGLWHLDKGTNRGDSGDPWPGNTNHTSFDANSIPGSRAYTGSLTKVGVKQISSSSALMTADIYVNDLVPVEISIFESD